VVGCCECGNKFFGTKKTGSVLIALVTISVPGRILEGINLVMYIM
jgi:hypothetical protein